MAGAIAHPDYGEFLDWCKDRADALSHKAIIIAENLDNNNRMGHLRRGYLAAVHFLRDNPNVRDWLSGLHLADREPFDHGSPHFAPAWSRFIAKHEAKHSILKHILPIRYGGLTSTGGGGGYPFKVAMRLTADFLAQTARAAAEEAERKIPAKYRMVRRKEFDRDYAELEELKRKYDHKCQVCQHRIEAGGGHYYCEAHHLRPLGREHRGPADPSNVIILCPNHHAEFDLFLFAILDYKGRRRKLEHMLRTLKAAESHLLVRHRIAAEHIDYVTEQFLTRLDLFGRT